MSGDESGSRGKHSTKRVTITSLGLRGVDEKLTVAVDPAVEVLGEGGSQTESDTKLLYCWMLRLRMSEHGPSTRSKRGLSSLTHLSGPRATTVAARGRFISKAISPGETHKCYDS